MLYLGRDWYRVELPRGVDAMLLLCLKKCAHELYFNYDKMFESRNMLFKFADRHIKMAAVPSWQRRVLRTAEICGRVSEDDWNRCDERKLSRSQRGFRAVADLYDERRRDFRRLR